MPEAVSIPPWLGNFAPSLLWASWWLELCSASHTAGLGHGDSTDQQLSSSDLWARLLVGTVTPALLAAGGFFQGMLVLVHILVLSSPDKSNVSKLWNVYLYVLPSLDVWTKSAVTLSVLLMTVLWLVSPNHSQTLWPCSVPGRSEGRHRASQTWTEVWRAPSPPSALPPNALFCIVFAPEDVMSLLAALSSLLLRLVM